jgi:phytoene desaturase
MKRIVVIGAGFGGLSAAAYLARAGYDVTVVEKNSWVGGRARVLEKNGFRFDMGPSWYWMPEEHDNWFRDMGEDRRLYYEIHRVDPSYQVFFGDVVPGETHNEVTVPAVYRQCRELFALYEPDGDIKLDAFIEQARRKYKFAIDHFVYRNYRSVFDMANGTTLCHLGELNLFRSYRGMIRRWFSHPYLQRILEFPVVFLGSFARKTPAVYTLMNHIDFTLGTWYPTGGFGRVVESMKEVAEKQGVRFLFNTPATGFRFQGNRVTAVSAGTELPADIVVANADYHHVDQELLPPEHRSFSPKFWNRRTLAPSVLNYYMGFSRKLPEFSHHTFFFDTDWDTHFEAVYGSPHFPEEPLFYLHIPSVTDPGCAPEGQEAVFALVPVAPGLEDTPEVRKKYREIVLDRMEACSGTSLRDSLVFCSEYSASDFTRDYNAYKGNAFGLGQTLFQTAYFRPANRSPRVSNLYFSGQYTVPGTGTTMSMISGKVAADRIMEDTGT